MKLTSRRSLSYIAGCLLIAASAYFYFAKDKALELWLQHVKGAPEVGAKLSRTPSGEIYFSAREGDTFSLFKYADQSVTKIQSAPFGTQQAVTLLNLSHAFYDSRGDGQYLLDPVPEGLSNRPLGKRLYVSPDGQHLFYQEHQDRSFRIFDAKNKRSFPTQFACLERIEGVAFSATQVIFSCGESLYFISLNNGGVTQSNTSLPGAKKYPHLHGRDLYFSNNSQSNFLQIYHWDTTTPATLPTLVLKEEADLLSPKLKETWLYFIKVVKSEYLLFRKDLKNGRTEQLTKEGVVYDYEIQNDGSVVATYSSMTLPRGLIRVTPNDEAIKILWGQPQAPYFSYAFVPATDVASPGFFITPNRTPKAVILYTHPGMHADFSPRWESYLFGLVKAGYALGVPNYPMSFGYGKSHFNKSAGEAVADLTTWVDLLKQQFPKAPLLFLSSSSGVYLQDAALASGLKPRASLSLFGLRLSQLRRFDSPHLAFLGRLDPVVPFASAKSALEQLRERSPAKVSIHTFDKEGHWPRRVQNLAEAISKSDEFFRNALNSSP